jgi:cytochrome P450
MKVSQVISDALGGPPTHWLFGFLPEFHRDSLGYLRRCRVYGDVVPLRCGWLIDLLTKRRGSAVYLLNTPADVKHVLVTAQHHYKKRVVPASETFIFGNGVLHSEDPLHRRQRRLMQPLFQGDHLKAYAPIVVEKTLALVEGWRDGQTIELAEEMTRLTLAVIWKVLFGADLGQEAHAISEAITLGQKQITSQYNSLLDMVLPLWWPSPTRRRFLCGVRFLHDTVDRQIRAQRQAARQGENILSRLLDTRDEDGQAMSDAQIRAEIMTLLLAGHETTANAMSWCWYLLALHVEVEREMREEVAAALDGRVPTMADLPRLSFVGQVLAEAMRLYPPAWILHARVAQTYDRLPSGHTIPTGMQVFLSPYAMQRDPAVFADPDRFDPDRFAPSQQSQIPAYGYFPFGGGARKCLGEPFAMLEGMLVLATLSQRVRLTLLPGQTIQPDPLLTLRPKTAVMMQVQRSENS